MCACRPDQVGNLFQGRLSTLVSHGPDNHVDWDMGKHRGHAIALFQGGAVDDQPSCAEAPAFRE